jgi:hypothetical protein
MQSAVAARRTHGAVVGIGAVIQRRDDMGPLEEIVQSDN